MSQCVTPWFHPIWDSLNFLDLNECFLSHENFLGKFSAIISSNIFSSPFSFSSPSGSPYNANVGVFNAAPEVSETVLISFHSFFFILFCGTDFHHSDFQITILLSQFIAWFLPFSFKLLYCSFLFVYSLNLLAPCWTFLISSPSVPPFFSWDFGSSLLSLCCIIFHVDCLSPFHFVVLSFFLVPLFATYFSVVLFCLTFCIFVLHSTGYRIIVPLASCVCPLVGEFGLGACSCFLVSGTCACSLVDGVVSLLFWWAWPYQGLSFEVAWGQYDFWQPVFCWEGLYSYLVVVCLVTFQHSSLQIVEGAGSWCWNVNLYSVFPGVSATRT